jgi:hypothetical protein
LTCDLFDEVLATLRNIARARRNPEISGLPNDRLLVSLLFCMASVGYWQQNKKSETFFFTYICHAF